MAGKTHKAQETPQPIKTAGEYQEIFEAITPKVLGVTVSRFGTGVITVTVPEEDVLKVMAAKGFKYQGTAWVGANYENRAVSLVPDDRPGLAKVGIQHVKEDDRF